MSRWCNTFNCFCDDVEEIIDESTRDMHGCGYCSNCEESEEIGD